MDSIQLQILEQNKVNPYPAVHHNPYENTVDPDQMASEKPSDQDLHCLSFSL